MITYRDRTFCASQVKVHTCGRELTETEKQEAIKLELPIAYGEFCKVDLSDKE